MNTQVDYRSIHLGSRPALSVTLFSSEAPYGNLNIGSGKASGELWEEEKERFKKFTICKKSFQEKKIVERFTLQL